jgi:triosephosphate isomerase
MTSPSPHGMDEYLAKAAVLCYRAGSPHLAPASGETMPLATPVVIGNWKMNGLRADALARVDALCARRGAERERGALGICPPATLLASLAERVRDHDILLGGQDCAPEASGAYTGDVSAAMLVDAGCNLVIVGHSERRHGHGEGDALVRAKAEAALRAGLTPILCIGESEAEWQSGETIAVLDRQLDGSLPDGATSERLIVAYEPVWAIGTGRTPEVEDIERTHAHLRAGLAERFTDGGAVRLLYGGSVKADNAASILRVTDVDGVLVGGASLDAESFWAIYEAGKA